MSEVTNESRIRGLLPECSGKNWDTYGAQPLTEEVVERACANLRALHPDYTFWPVPCTDGGIVFEGLGDWDGIDLKVEP